MSGMHYLPDEIVLVILNHLCFEDGSPTASLLSLSTTCKKLRNVALTILFRKLLFDLNLSRSGHDDSSAERLLANRTICESVREVHLKRSRSQFSRTLLTNEEDSKDYHELIRLFRQLPSVKALRIYANGPQIEPRYMEEFLELVIKVWPGVRICSDQLILGQILPMEKDRIARSVAETTYVTKEDPDFDYLNSTISRFDRLRALHINWGEIWSHRLSSLLPLANGPATKIHLPSLKDLYLKSFSHLQVLDHLKTPVLRKLKVAVVMESSDSAHVEESLRSFSRRTPSVKSFALAIFSLDLESRYNCVAEAILPNWKPSELLLDDSLIDQLPLNLVTFLSRAESQSNFLPGLRSLRLHQSKRSVSIEANPSTNTTDCLSILLRTSPHLTRLEINTHHLDKLGDPTAVSGVDLDIRIYSILQQLAQFPHLTFIRLMPPYQRPTTSAPGDPDALQQNVQPLTDDGQAVRIFQALRDHGSRLQRLVISPSPADEGRGRPSNKERVVWEVRELGEMVMLIVRQQGRDHEQRQVWSGQRRLRTSVKRFRWERRWEEICG